MTLKRACSLLTVKSFSEDERVITGIASTPSPDRDGDILEPEGAEFAVRSRFSGSMTIPACRPVYGASGQGRAGNHGNAGEAGAGMPSQMAARLMRPGLPLRPAGQGLSVGFRPMNTLIWTEADCISALGADGGVCVTVPANAECTIRTIKYFDRPFSAASGNRKPVVKIASSAGASAQSITSFHKESQQ